VGQQQASDEPLDEPPEEGLSLGWTGEELAELDPLGGDGNEEPPEDGRPLGLEGEELAELDPPDGCGLLLDGLLDTPSKMRMRSAGAISGGPFANCCSRTWAKSCVDSHSFVCDRNWMYGDVVLSPNEKLSNYGLHQAV
jgi:hypothetical protein